MLLSVHHGSHLRNPHLTWENNKREKPVYLLRIYYISITLLPSAHAAHLIILIHMNCCLPEQLYSSNSQLIAQLRNSLHKLTIHSTKYQLISQLLNSFHTLTIALFIIQIHTSNHKCAIRFTNSQFISQLRGVHYTITDLDLQSTPSHEPAGF